jgi:hypothetical protein
MAVSVSKIKVGKCFVTANGQFREVVDIRVNYRYRGKNPKGTWDYPTNLPLIETFAEAVKEEVDCGPKDPGGKPKRQRSTAR